MWLGALAARNPRYARRQAAPTRAILSRQRNKLMARRAPREDDQLSRFGHELREGDWLAHARNRSQRRKSPWNLLLPLFGLPLLAAFVVLFVWFASAVHSFIHPNHPHAFLGPGPAGIGDVLVLLPAFVAAVAPAFLVTNFLVYLIPPARRAMAAEDRDYPGVGYGPSQRALFKFGLWLLAICLPLIIIGAALK